MGSFNHFMGSRFPLWLVLSLYNESHFSHLSVPLDDGSFLSSHLHCSLIIPSIKYRVLLFPYAHAHWALLLFLFYWALLLFLCAYWALFFPCCTFPFVASVFPAGWRQKSTRATSALAVFASTRARVRLHVPSSFDVPLATSVSHGTAHLSSRYFASSRCGRVVDAVEV